MNLSIRILLRLDKPNSDKQYPIHIRLTQNRKHYYIATKHRVSYDQWDEVRLRVKKNCPAQKAINEDLSEIYNRIIRLSNDDLHPTQIIQQIKKLPEAPPELTVPLVGVAITDLAKQLRAANRISYARAFDDLHSALLRFWQEDKPATAITYTMLVDWETFLLQNGCRMNSVYVYMRHLKVVVNRLRKAGLMPKEWYPFESFSFSRYGRIRTIKRAISQEAIQQLIQLEPPTLAQLKARDFLLFSYYCRGINYRDMALLTSENLHEGRLMYIRSKTKKSFSIKVTEPVQTILTNYHNKGGYLLPILDKRIDQTPEAIEEKIRSSRQNVNRCLRKLGKSIGLNLNITTYTARHSFATGLKKKGVRNGLISEMMGHPTEAVTQIYLKSFEDDELDSAAEVLL
ncbi:tyrosine-type recombinase/integrase [Spirosoma soli]|uniref:Tyrosine-type recombinase/integrase n=1 Tax=Spirosoma soli TaxID=1770529 RepID=A0ABW5MDZ7_9BACT